MTYVIVILLVIAAILAVTTYNTLVTLRERMRQAFADIDVQLRQRHDLVPHLVATVKAYAAHERETLEAVVEARQAAVAVEEKEGQVPAEERLSGALGRLFALSEAYPDLKADANFRDLQHQLTQVEDKLAAARRFFNLAVAEYNAALSAFPAMLFARLLGFSHGEFFDLPVTDRGHLEGPPPVTF